MDKQAHIKPLFRLIFLTRTSLFISNLFIYTQICSKNYENFINICLLKELINNSSGN
jgi:hypothetical protein